MSSILNNIETKHAYTHGYDLLQILKWILGCSNMEHNTLDQLEINNTSYSFTTEPFVWFVFCYDTIGLSLKYLNYNTAVRLSLKYLNFMACVTI